MVAALSMGRIFSLYISRQIFTVDSVTGLVTVLKSGTAVITATASAVGNYLQTSVSCVLIVVEESGGDPTPDIPDTPDIPTPDVPDAPCDGTVSGGCPAAQFSDINTGSWYHEAVDYVLKNGLMNGTGSGTFAPGGITSRAMIVTILWRLEGKPQVNYLMDFEDVAAESWYTEAVRWAAAEGIMGGYGDGRFGTNDAITREQLATVLYRYVQYKGYDVSAKKSLDSYTDASAVHSWAVDAMQWACSIGLIKGIEQENGFTLDPVGNATRAQVATIFWRFCETIKAEE